MGGPAGVADAGVAIRPGCFEQGEQVGRAAEDAVHGETGAGERHAHRVIAAILEAPECRGQIHRHRMPIHHAHNAAHAIRS